MRAIGGVTTAMVLNTFTLDEDASLFNIPCLVLRILAPLILSCASLACADGPTAPSRGGLVTFGVADETFRVHLLDERKSMPPIKRRTAGGHVFPTAALLSGQASMSGGVGTSRTSSLRN